MPLEALRYGVIIQQFVLVHSEYSNGLYHHGIKGMKWGIRRYQNPDGSLTAIGKKRYNLNIYYARKRKMKMLL